MLSYWCYLSCESGDALLSVFYWPDGPSRVVSVRGAVVIPRPYAYPLPSRPIKKKRVLIPDLVKPDATFLGRLSCATSHLRVEFGQRSSHTCLALIVHRSCSFNLIILSIWREVSDSRRASIRLLQPSYVGMRCHYRRAAFKQPCSLIIQCLRTSTLTPLDPLDQSILIHPSSDLFNRDLSSTFGK